MIAKTILVFIATLIGSGIAWSILLFLVASSMGATQNEAADFETSAAPLLALVTALVVTYRWRKRRQ